jgi:hypothetical protein
VILTSEGIHEIQSKVKVEQEMNWNRQSIGNLVLVVNQISLHLENQVP